MAGFRSVFGLGASPNRIAWLGAAIIVVIAALWTAFGHVFPAKSERGGAKGGVGGDRGILRLQEEADALYHKGDQSGDNVALAAACLLYTSPSPRDS